jgi:hypothetical protein
MQLKIKQRLQSIMRLGNGSSSGQISPSRKAYPTLLSYHTIPLNVFIDQVEDRTIDKIIYEEFLFAIRDTEQNYYMRLVKEINILEAKYHMVELIVTRLAIKESDEIRKILAQVLPVRATDSLQVIVTRSRRFLQEIEIKKAELERLQPVAEHGQADRKYFTHLIIQVTKHLKVQIDKYKVTAFEFGEMIIDMREHYNQLKKEIANKNAR